MDKPIVPVENKYAAIRRFEFDFQVSINGSNI